MYQQQTTTGRMVCMAAALVMVGALISAGVVFGGRATPPAHAAPQTARAAPAPLAAAVTEETKVTLPETSIAGPGFDGNIA